MPNFTLSSETLAALARLAPQWQSGLAGRPLKVNDEFSLHYFADAVLDEIFCRDDQPVRLNYVRVQQPDRQPHVHFKTTEIFLVLEGQGVFMAGKDDIAVVPGDVLVVPRGQPHYFRELIGGEVHCFNVQIGPILDAKGREDFERWEHIKPSRRPFRAAFPEHAIVAHIDF